jgi:anti-sigma factor RsiW
MHEQFAQEVARLSEQDALGRAGEDAYVAVGFARHRHNHIRLPRRERAAKRIAWLRFEREAAARAASMSPGKVIEELRARGIERFDDLVERNAAGIVGVRELSSCLPVEVGIGALKMVHRAFGIKSPVGS